MKMCAQVRHLENNVIIMKPALILFNKIYFGKTLDYESAAISISSRLSSLYLF